jgi:hypothetical protein
MLLLKCNDAIEIKSFVEDVSPALLATIEQEFEKVSKMDPPQPTKAPAGSVSFCSFLILDKDINLS